MQERVQRWLANQQNASWIVETLDMKIDEVPVLVIWSHTFGTHATTEAARLIAQDVVQMLMLPEIIVGLHFEREIGLYFEVTSKWHETLGSLSTHSGFR
eukprot:5741915-Ditylum_brightwellii.AAC.1